MSLTQSPINTSVGSKPRQRKTVTTPTRVTNHESDLSHIAPGLRPLAMPVAELRLMVGNPRSHPAKNLEAIKAALVEYGRKPSQAALGSNSRQRPPASGSGTGMVPRGR